MRKWICFIAATAIACNSKDRSANVAAVVSPTESEWMTYEGRVPLDEKSALYIELSLQTTNENGEGEFRLQEFLEDQHTSARISSFDGVYTSLQGQKSDEKVVQFHNTSLAKGVKRTYVTANVIREEHFRTGDLTVRMSEKDKLIVLDEQMRTVSDEAEHNLVRRLARPFTIEGYFRHNGYSANFFEINTGESWQVTKYGEYEKAIRQYYQLTDKKFEVTYLKGLGFPVRSAPRKGSETEALVIKRVLQMTSAPAINQE